MYVLFINNILTLLANKNGTVIDSKIVISSPRQMYSANASLPGV